VNINNLINELDRLVQLRNLTVSKHKRRALNADIKRLKFDVKRTQKAQSLVGA
jgi:hypothetical protein